MADTSTIDGVASPAAGGGSQKPDKYAHIGDGGFDVGGIRRYVFRIVVDNEDVTRARRMKVEAGSAVEIYGDRLRFFNRLGFVVGGTFYRIPKFNSKQGTIISFVIPDNYEEKFSDRTELELAFVQDTLDNPNTRLLGGFEYEKEAGNKDESGKQKPAERLAAEKQAKETARSRVLEQIVTGTIGLVPEGVAQGVAGSSGTVKTARTSAAGMAGQGTGAAPSGFSRTSVRQAGADDVNDGPDIEQEIATTTELDGETTTISGGTVSAQGTISTGGTASTSESVEVTSQGTVTTPASVEISSDGTVTGTGQATISGTASAVQSAGVSAAGTAQTSGTQTVSGQLSVSGTAASDEQIVQSGAAGGQRVDVNGSVEAQGALDQTVQVKTGAGVPSGGGTKAAAGAKNDITGRVSGAVPSATRGAAGAGPSANLSVPGTAGPNASNPPVSAGTAATAAAGANTNLAQGGMPLGTVPQAGVSGGEAEGGQSDSSGTGGAPSAEEESAAKNIAGAGMSSTPGKPAEPAAQHPSAAAPAPTSAAGQEILNRLRQNEQQHPVAGAVAPPPAAPGAAGQGSRPLTLPPSGKNNGEDKTGAGGRGGVDSVLPPGGSAGTKTVGHESSSASENGQGEAGRRKAGEAAADRTAQDTGQEGQPNTTPPPGASLPPSGARSQEAPAAGGDTDGGKGADDQAQPDADAEPEDQQVPVSRAAGSAEAEKERLLSEAVRMINPYINGFLIQGAVWVWAFSLPSFGLSVLLGAIVGDFLWVFKKRLIRMAMNRVMLPQVIVGKQFDPDDVARQIKFSGGVKANIVAMNVVVGIVIALFATIVVIVGCNDLASRVSIIAVTGSDVCDLVDASSNNSDSNPPATGQPVFGGGDFGGAGASDSWGEDRAGVQPRGGQ